MTLGRWLLIHSLSISIVVMLGVGYFFKNELKLSEAYNQLLLIDRSNLVISKDVKDKEVDDRVLEASNTTSNKTVDIRKLSIGTLPNKENNNVMAISSDTAVSSINHQNTVNKQPLIEITAEDYLLKAREAYWDENYQYAIELYSAEIIKDPSSADLYGELGNIYYSLNNYETAAVYYLKAGEIFLLNRDEMRAKKIYDILTSIAPIKAEILLQLKNERYQVKN